jgi:hypothetical protein
VLFVGFVSLLVVLVVFVVVFVVLVFIGCICCLIALIIVVGGIVVEFGIAITLFPTFGVLVYVVVVTRLLCVVVVCWEWGAGSFLGAIQKTWSAFP